MSAQPEGEEGRRDGGPYFGVGTIHSHFDDAEKKTQIYGRSKKNKHFFIVLFLVLEIIYYLDEEWRLKFNLLLGILLRTYVSIRLALHEKHWAFIRSATE